MDREAGVTVRYVEAAAEDTGFPEASFDLVIAGQCWFWFDRQRAANEARRILKPGWASRDRALRLDSAAWQCRRPNGKAH